MSPADTRPPGPSSVAALRAIVVTRATDPGFFTRCAARYPRVAHVRVGREHLYLLAHPDLVRLLLVDAGRQTTKSRGLRGARQILGDGLLTSSGQLHRRQRRVIQPAFHRERVAGYTVRMAAAASRRAAAWSAGQRVDMAGEMSGLTFQIVAEALFGSDLERDFDTVAAALAELLGAYNRSFLPWFDLSMRLRTPLARRVAAAKARLDGVVETMIARHDPAADDLLSAMQAAAMDPRLLRDEALTLLLAGHETTASTLGFTWYLLDRHPDAAEWLQEELAGSDCGLTGAAGSVGPAFGEDPGALLPRTRAVIAEAMRLYPPAWVLGRRLTADLDVDEWCVPAGSTCLVSQWVLHRDPRFWTEPGSFRPQRWIGAGGAFDLDAPGQPRLAYFPFGAGNRICVGEPFALAEAVIVLAVLARGWRPELDPGYTLALRPGITLRPAGALPMTLRPR